jgi:hypothetical protein
VLRHAAGSILLVVAAALALLVVDHRAPDVVLDADGWRDRPFFIDFGPFKDGYRIASPASELRLTGLWPAAPVEVSAAVASALPRGQDVHVLANGFLVHRSDVGGRYATLQFSAWTDAQGRLALRFLAPRARGERALRVSWVRAHGGGSGPVAWFRLPVYAGALALALLGAAWLGVSARVRLLVLAMTAVLIAAGLVWSRLLLLAWLPRATVCAGAGLLLAVLAAAALPFARSSAAWWGAVVAFRVFLLPLPDLGSIDLTFHAHNIERFQRGEVLGSAVSDALGNAVFIPYPPALYAALAPFVALGDTASGETAVRWAMILLEAAAPLVVFATMRAAGAGDAAAALGAAALAVMPEGMLVVPKGVAANVAGSFLALLAVWALAARASPFVVAGLTAVAFLGHPGSAATAAGWIGAWSLLERRADGEPAARVRLVLAAVAAAAFLAWAVYYREVAHATRESLGHFAGEAAAIRGRFTSVRWTHVGKMLQDVALKFGLGPFLLALVGLQRGLPQRLRTLVHASLLVAGALAVLAVLTPVALRFEYFVAPALAMAAGIGAGHLRANGRGGWVTAAFAASLALQAMLALALHSGAFDPINVIIPSPRWPLLADVMRR